MSKKLFSERDICTKFITPALENAGWDIKSLRFFEIKKDKFVTISKVTYTPLSASNELSSLFNREFKDQAESINNLLDKFQDKTWEFCERISTMYAIWNNRLIRKELFTYEILKQDFLAWDDKKK